MVGFGCDLGGRLVRYDFSGIESSVATRILTNTTYIDVDKGITHFGFLDDLQQELGTHILKALSQALTQEPLAHAHQLREDVFFKETHHGMAMLRLLELVIFNVTKSRPDPDDTLCKYCATFGLGQGPLEQRALQCDSIGGLKLRHLRSLYELIEDIVADAVLPAVPDRFQQPFSDASVAVDKACLALGRNRGGSDTAAMSAGHLRLEPVLKKFVFRHLREGAELEPTYPLLTSAMDERHFEWPEGDEPSEAELEEAFPMTLSDILGAEPSQIVLVSHAYAILRELQERSGAGSSAAST
eukprot:TRINITY_DN36961_c0_g1_i1.p1 TRINITY_DN36961_c0_g1~~TRINITY_DN36961_c0_g1_i1.p1  ORF type:complete len:299 (-),score=40.62 TRINITY_DN36961_c0_g1_i1:505-1401(-)